MDAHSGWGSAPQSPRHTSNQETHQVYASIHNHRPEGPYPKGGLGANPTRAKTQTGNGNGLQGSTSGEKGGRQGSFVQDPGVAIGHRLSKDSGRPPSIVPLVEPPRPVTAQKGEASTGNRDFLHTSSDNQRAEANVEDLPSPKTPVVHPSPTGPPEGETPRSFTKPENEIQELPLTPEEIEVAHAANLASFKGQKTHWFVKKMNNLWKKLTSRYKVNWNRLVHFFSRTKPKSQPGKFKKLFLFKDAPGKPGETADSILAQKAEDGKLPVIKKPEKEVTPHLPVTD